MQSRRNFTWLCGIYDACLDVNLYLLGVEVASWGPLILTAVVPVGVLCVKLPCFVTTSLGLGVPVVK